MTPSGALRAATIALIGGFALACFLVAPRLVEGIPVFATGVVVDEYTGQPVPGALVRAGPIESRTERDGTFNLFGAVRGSRVEVEAAGYTRSPAASPDQSRIVLRATHLVGGVFDAKTKKPINGATLATQAGIARTGVEGIFRLSDTSPGQKIAVTAAGYKKLELDAPARVRLDIELQPTEIRAIWLSAATIAFDEQREKLFALFATTELNAVVIDVKSDTGVLAYRSTIADVAQYGGNPLIAPDLPLIVAQLRARGVHTIARVEVFRDRALSTARPELALKDRFRTNARYQDEEGKFWVDPTSPAAQDYNLAIIEELSRMGFDEILLDRFTFPVDSRPERMVFTTQFAPTAETRVAAVQGFLRLAAARARPRGAMLSVSVVGYAAFRQRSIDLNIGVQLEALVPFVDHIALILHPSAFAAGAPGVGDGSRNAAINDPFQTVLKSLESAKAITRSDGAVFLPWLQYFDDYQFQTGRRYGQEEIAAQKRAAMEAGTRGWILQDPTNLYARGGIEPKR